MSGYWVRIGGQPLSEVAPYSPPTWETLADGGCGQASLTLGGSKLAQVRSVRAGVRAEILLGAQPVYSGEVMDFDPATGEVNMVGLAAVAAEFLALDSAGNATLDTSTATGEAAGRGWGVVNRTGSFGVVDGDVGSPQTVGSLLTQYGTQAGQRWGVDGWSRLYMRPDPTTPKWLITPGAIVLGGTTEGRISHYVVRYDNGTTFATVIVPHPQAARMTRREEAMDLTDRGVLTLAEATAVAAGQHTLATASAWTNGATVTSDQIRTIGDTPAALPVVRGGDMARVFSTIPAAGQSSMWFDVVFGKTKHTAGEKVIYLEPANTAPRTFADVIAA